MLIDGKPVEVLETPYREVAYLRAENEKLTEELTEQARLLGISAEKELTLLSKIERLGRELAATIKERNAFQDQCIRLEQKRALEKFELAEVKQDAERYRWLHENCESVSWNPSRFNLEIVSGFSAFGVDYVGYGFEQAIQLAMKGK